MGSSSNDCIEDPAGNAYKGVNARLLFLETARKLLQTWTRELQCPIAALVLLCILEDQMSHVVNGATLPVRSKLTTREIEMRTSIPKSTVSRKLRLLSEIGMIDVNQGEISIPVDEKGNSVLLKFIPNGKILLDNMVNTTQRS